MENDDGKKINVLTFSVFAVFAIISLAGYVRLYYLIMDGKVAIPYLSASLVVQKEVPIDKKVFGYSTKGKPIEGYVIGNGNNTILLLASIHGDEVGTTDLLNQFVDEVKANPNLVLTENRLVVIPIANPDGYYDRRDKLNANGVNLNLNFATDDWKQYGPEGTYAGPKPFSEVESQTIRQVVQDYKPSMMISYHASGALVTPEDDDASVTLGKWYAKETGYAYYDDTNFDWDFPGTATKWFSQTTKNPAITVELTKYVPSDWDINKKVLLELVSSNINLQE